MIFFMSGQRGPSGLVLSRGCGGGGTYAIKTETGAEELGRFRVGKRTKSDASGFVLTLIWNIPVRNRLLDSLVM